MAGRDEDDLDDAADMSDPPATEALRDPPDSDTGEIKGRARESSQGQEENKRNKKRD